MKRLLSWLLDRADEPSTWRGLFFIGSALGFLTLEPEQAAILAAGLAMVFGGADVVVPEPTRKLRRQPIDDDIDLDELADDELRDTVHNLPGQRRAAADNDAKRIESAADAARRTWLD